MVKALAALGACMVGYVVYMHASLGKQFADVAVGYAAGLVVVGCALAVHMFYKKGEVR